MNTFKNINDIVDDATILGIISPLRYPLEIFSDIPSVEDEVSLDTNENYAMTVEVTEISEDREIFRGKVTRGYYPKDEKEWIDVGAIVEFSRKKIGGIYKK